MKLFKIGIILLCLLSFSCSKNDNPVASQDGFADYIGGIGTQRVYRTTERWLQPGTNIPYYSVPDSLRHRLSIDSAQIAEGICSIANYTENVNEIGDDFYTSWKLNSPRNSYRRLASLSGGTIYNLAYELDALINGTVYSLGGYGIGDNIYHDSIDAYYSVPMPENIKIAPIVPYIKKVLMVGNSWSRYKFVDTSKSKTTIEDIAQVVDKVHLTLSCGTVDAYKIKITGYHYDPDYNFDMGYEYFVPNVGLVLKESDMELYQWNSSTGTTVAFRQIIRQELISYNFIK